MFRFDVIRFTSYGVIAEKPRVGQLGRIFSVNFVGKTMRWIENDDNFFDGPDELYHHAKFGEDCATDWL